MNDFYQKSIENLLHKANININGSNPWDIQIHNKSVYRYIFKNGSLGLGESYINGLWDCERLDELLFRILVADLEHNVSFNFRVLKYLLSAKLFNLQSKNRAYEVGKKHYDLGNDLYSAFLDERMVYSCAYWKDAKTLEEAQINKLELICQKLNLKPGHKLLDIGCGWGGFAKYAAEKYQVNVVGITISEQQAEYAIRACKDLPVEIYLQDYRDIQKKFDRVVSIGMFEHVGYKNYRIYMNIIHRCLKKDGLFLLHCIGGNSSVSVTDPWINTYIFPNGMIPSVTQIGRAIEGKFVMEDWHNFGTFYDITLMEWLKRFKKNWPELKKIYDERFFRIWTYYLSGSAASFRAKKNNLWQLVLAPSTNLSPYQSIR